MGIFSSKTDAVRFLEDGMGSEGSIEQAEKMYEYMRENGWIDVSDAGIRFALTESEFYKIWNHILL
jgi:pentatricopeptide repeat protein